MFKIVRNTAFTALALVLTAVGLSWNSRVALKNDPVAISQAVLASQTDQPVSDDNQQIPLEVDLSRKTVRLGQLQVVTITTVPGAELDIVTQYPDGSVNNSQTVRVVADQNGRYIQRYRLDNFRHLGVFHKTVVATTPTRTTTVGRKFVLQSWAKDQPGLAEEVTGYKHPLVP